MNLSSEFVRRVRQNIQTYAIILALIAIWILFAVLTEGRYLNSQNFSNLFRQMTVVSFMAIGMVLVIVTGNIDLSVGKAAGLVSVVAAYLQFYTWHEYIPDQPLLAASLSVIIGLVVGTLIFGVLQGYLIAYLGIPSFIVTLAGLFLGRGGILLVTQGKTIAANQPYFEDIAQGHLSQPAGWVIAAIVVVFLFVNMFRSRQRKQQYGFQVSPVALDLSMTIFFSILVLGFVYIVNKYQGLQVPVLLLAIAAIIMVYVSDNTRFGKYAYAIGGNREAARLSGINIRKSIFSVMVLMGFLSSVGGIVLASYVGYGTIAAGEGYELDAIAAAILGGTSTLGGEGTVLGALIGALIMTSLVTGLQMLNVPSAYQYLVRGVVLVLAVYADVVLKKSR